VIRELLRLLPLAVLVAGGLWCLLVLLFVSGGPTA
jgi:hypothetical protein